MTASSGLRAPSIRQYRATGSMLGTTGGSTWSAKIATTLGLFTLGMENRARLGIVRGVAVKGLSVRLGIGCARPGLHIL